MTRMVLRATTLALLASSISAPPRRAANLTRLAAPEIIIFQGGPLKKSIVVASWTENHYLLLSDVPHEPVPSGHPPAGERPIIQLALFWGSQWRAYAESPTQLATLRSVQANQLGEYLPAIPGARAMIRVGSIAGPVSDSGLAVLRRHGIPTQLP